MFLRFHIECFTALFNKIRTFISNKTALSEKKWIIRLKSHLSSIKCCLCFAKMTLYFCENCQLFFVTNLEIITVAKILGIYYSGGKLAFICLPFIGYVPESNPLVSCFWTSELFILSLTTPSCSEILTGAETRWSHESLQRFTSTHFRLKMSGVWGISEC